MPSDLTLLSTLIGSNYPCLELIFMAPKVFEPLEFDCILRFPVTDFVVIVSIRNLNVKFQRIVECQYLQFDNC